MEQIHLIIILQFAPIDTPMAVQRFLLHWTPQAAIFMESELWPTLVLETAQKGIPLALLNARMSLKSFERWSAAPMQPLVAAMLSQFSLIAPLSTKEAIRYQILGAAPSIIHFAGNLKYACAVADAQKESSSGLADIEAALKDRKVWLAASTHAEEEDAIIRIHKELKNWVPRLLTIVAPRQPSRGHAIMTRFRQQGFGVAVRSEGHQISSNIDVYMVDTLGELNHFYAMVPIAFVGGSLVQGLAGHNLAEAAAAGCIVLTGYHIGHFQEMVEEMQKMSPLSVQQVSVYETLFWNSVISNIKNGTNRNLRMAFLTVSTCVTTAPISSQVDEEGLVDNLRKFLTAEDSYLDERRAAADGALRAAASGVSTRVWELLESCILKKVLI
ncbi:hypothetical protein KC19_8G071000 [Ceratodon purpureus]|uniref:lipid IVA 3-deoxy-D-manno-octulosonic acid transferase n=1 Tax=Ceratodon purpureus TaxID=3225 RepID=A0A8T0GW92_CERPU|nr:hypothetical protein KC19_8G071000 [Ceratodon purpureus]